ncbi:peptidoglycan-binding protein [Nitrosomonas communis]|uniref:peptidoglycan-binding protein n=1 Tax=Nitrosomonas communis TaxID=44574 RepID=UPI0026F15548|nr:peptidoglycan-binding protein [Nitrosomonas communis]MCO6428339.1 peptidoglycan-binding protein [Nitrosomonas communis]
MSILWQGARGLIVKELQAKLKEFGFDPGPADGIFGPATTAAVTAFQKYQKLFADGIAGPQTFSTLELSTASVEAPTPARTKVFVSYSHADEKWLRMFQVHIAPLERSGVVDRWDDTKILPGKKWREEIAQAIQSAKVAILLISAYFMASEFIAENELPPLLEAAEHDGAVILPVIISPCVMGNLATFQAVNSPSKPLVDLSRGDRDRVWVKLVEAITAALNE